jgi:O-antigen/teichoic acid export membrane protein
MFARKSLLIVISTFLSSILGFIGLLAMTNYLGKDVYGNISWVIATLATLNIVSDLGFNSAHIKRLSEGQDERDCVATFAVIKLVLTLVMVVFVLAALIVWNNVMGGDTSPETWNLVILFLLYFVMYDIASIFITTFQAKMETTKSEIVTVVDPFIRIPLIIFISVNHLGSDLAYAYVLASIGVLLVSLLLLRRGDIHWTKPTMYRSYLKFALPLSLIAIAGAVTANLDKILIGYFDSPSNVAYYSSAQTLLATLGIVGTAVASLAFPAFSRLHSDGDLQSIRNVTYAAERYISMIAVPIVTFIIIFPTEVSVTIFGPQFAPGGESMRFLAIGIGLTLLNQVYASQILGVNRPDISAKITLGTFLLNIILLLLLVPDSLFGVKMLGMSYAGAAIATALTAFVVFLWQRLIVKKLTETGSNPRILRHLVAAAFAGVVILALNMVLPFSGIIAFVIFAGATLVAFFAALTILKEFGRADIDYFLDLMSPSKMFSYMGEEMKDKRQ